MDLVQREPDGGNLIAETKGVPREEGSEGRLRQIPGADEQELNSRPDTKGQACLEAYNPNSHPGMYQVNSAAAEASCKFLPREICGMG